MTISAQVLGLDWHTEPRDAHGRFARAPGGNGSTKHPAKFRAAGGHTVTVVHTADRGQFFQVTTPDGYNVPLDPWNPRGKAEIRTPAQLAAVLARQGEDMATLEQVAPPVSLAALGTISSQVELASAAAHAKAHATASATAKAHARAAMLRELRDPHTGEWIKEDASPQLGSKTRLESAAVGRRASAVRMHDHVLHYETEMRPMGMVAHVRPGEVIALRHHYEGGTGTHTEYDWDQGKNVKKRNKKTRYTDYTLRLDDGTEVDSSVKDGSTVRLFPREEVKAGPKPKPAAPFDWKNTPLMTLAPQPGDKAIAQQARANQAASPPEPAPPPPPSPAPPATQYIPAGQTYYHGSPHQFQPGDLIDPQHAKLGVTEMQGGQYAFMSRDPGEARFFDKSGGRGYLYRVVPESGYEDDPHMHEGTSLRTPGALRVVSEIKPGEDTPMIPASALAKEHAGTITQQAKAVTPPAPASPTPAPGRISKKITAQPGAFSDPAAQQKALAETQHALDIQTALIPHTAARMKVTYMDPAKMGNAMGLSGGMFSPKISDAGTGGLASKDAARYRADGFWARADSSHTMADTVIAHETGHTLLPGAAAYSMDLWTGLAKTLGLPPPSKGWPSGNAKYKDFADVDSWIKDNKSAVEAAVSRYGASNSAEMMAEMWSEYTMSSTPGPAAQFYGDWALAQLGEKA